MSKAEINDNIRVYISKLFAHMVEDLEDENGLIKSKDVENWTCSENIQEIISLIPEKAKEKAEKKAKEKAEKKDVLSSLILDIKKDIQEAIIEKETKEVRKRRRGRPKKKEGEKGVCSAYMFFCKEERKVLKEKYPEWNRKEIMTWIGLQWKYVKKSEEGKKYYEMSNKDRLSKMK